MSEERQDKSHAGQQGWVKTLSSGNRLADERRSEQIEREVHLHDVDKHGTKDHSGLGGKEKGDQSRRQSRPPGGAETTK